MTLQLLPSEFPYMRGNFFSIFFQCGSPTVDKMYRNLADRKENKIFFIYKEIQSGAVAKSYMRKGFLIYEEMRKYFPIYEKAVPLQLLPSEFPYI